MSPNLSNKPYLHHGILGTSHICIFKHHPPPHCSLHARSSNSCCMLANTHVGTVPRSTGLTCILCNDVRFFNDSPFAVKTIYATCIFQHFNLLATTSTSACRLLLFCECDLTIFYNLGLRVFCNDYHLAMNPMGYWTRS